MQASANGPRRLLVDDWSEAIGLNVQAKDLVFQVQPHPWQPEDFAGALQSDPKRRDWIQCVKHGVGGAITRAHLPSSGLGMLLRAV